MEELHADREVVLAAVAQNGRALEYASQELSGFRRSVLCPDVMTFLSMVARTWTSQASPNASSLASLSGL